VARARRKMQQLPRAAPYDGTVDPLDELNNSMEDRINALPERKRMMMRLRFGLADGRFWDLREIARQFDTDRDEVRKVEAELFDD
jgi:DNA-directed RNA polymerase sigma subunit (sigma70/sigma32)